MTADRRACVFDALELCEAAGPRGTEGGLVEAVFTYEANGGGDGMEQEEQEEGACKPWVMTFHFSTDHDRMRRVRVRLSLLPLSPAPLPARPQSIA